MTQDRTGLTEITSVSVSKEFNDILKEYKLSPSEVFRRGIAVTLCDLGIVKYDNNLNQERLRKSNEVLKSIDSKIKARKKLLESIKVMKRAVEVLDDIQTQA